MPKTNCNHLNLGPSFKAHGHEFGKPGYVQVATCQDCGAQIENAYVKKILGVDLNGKAKTQFTIELDSEDALALAQFLKRITWNDMRGCAIDENETYRIKDALGKLQRAAKVSYRIAYTTAINLALDPAFGKGLYFTLSASFRGSIGGFLAAFVATVFKHFPGQYIPKR